MAKKSHQHFIPRTYLKRFAHRSEGDVDFVDTVNVTTLEIKEDIAVSNLCVDCDLYTLKKLDIHEKYKIEDFFNNEIENDYLSVYNILTNDSIQNIGLGQRVKILKTLLSMYFRTPKILNQFVSNSVKFINELKTKDIGEFSFMGIDFDLSSQSLEEIRKEIRERNREDFIKTSLVLMGEFLRLRAFDGIVVIKLIGEQEFITSDNPVTITNIHGQLLDLFSFNNSIYVPINPKYCVFIAPSSEGAIVNKIYRNQDNFMQHIILNDSTFRNSERWCIGTKTGITRFISDEVEYSKPADENHPIILQAKEKLRIMMVLARLAENGKMKELIDYVDAHKDDDLFKNDASLTKIVEQLKRI